MAFGQFSGLIQLLKFRERILGANKAVILFQAWYYDHGNDEKNKGTLDSMLHEEKKHFPGGASAVAVLNAAPSLSVPKVSPLWSKDDIELLVNGIVSTSRLLVKC